MTADGATEFSWRPIERADVAAWLRLHEAIEAVELEDEHPDEAELLERFDDPAVDMARGSLACWDGERMVAHHWMKARTAADPVHNFWQLGGVDPEYRGRGLGAHLLNWAEGAARTLHEERFPGAPLAMMDGCGAGSVSETLFAALGYEQVRWFRNMVIDELASVVPGLPESPVPAGVVVHAFTPERAADAMQVRNDSFVDHYDSQPHTPETWAHFTTGSAFRPANSFIAYEEADGTPLAIVLCEEFEAREQLTGKRELYVALVGTARGGRKRGIASALLAHTLREGLAAGYDLSSLGVDADNPTGAFGLYERLGYRPHQTFVAQRKLLTR